MLHHEHYGVMADYPLECTTEYVPSFAKVLRRFIGPIMEEAHQEEQPQATPSEGADEVK